MGTNYFARIDCCDKCGRPAHERHIGKQSAGWPFLLDPGEKWDDLFGPLTSWCAWKAILQRPNVRIFNEYGEEQDKAEFIARVEESGRKPLPDFARAEDAAYERRDPDGYRFSTSTGFG